jgi:alpha-mannosidase
LDGTSVLTHFSPADTYTAQASVKDAVFMVKNNKDKQYSNKSLLLYGNGDGGGGPLKPMLERIKRFGNLADMPAKCSFGNPEEFYKQLEESSKDLSTWQGELYFELHRGTYTTHALIKKFNRKCEFLLCEIELLFSQAICAKLLGFEKYPKKELDRLWKLVLLNQFHDVLPGSSIGMVYVDAIDYFEDVVLSGNKLKNEVLSVLVKSNTAAANHWFFNPSSWTRNNVMVEIKGEGAKDCLQKTSDGHGLAIVASMDPLSWTELSNMKTIPAIPVKGKSKQRILKSIFYIQTSLLMTRILTLF